MSHVDVIVGNWNGPSPARPVCGSLIPLLQAAALVRLCKLSTDRHGCPLRHGGLFFYEDVKRDNVPRITGETLQS